jgi:hypothetical protein
MILDEIQDGIYPAILCSRIAAIGRPEGLMKDDFHPNTLFIKDSPRM